jgi:hypothetical protein
MDPHKLIKICGVRHNGNLALKIMKRYNLSFQEANQHYVAGQSEWKAKYGDSWSFIGIAREASE